jgi:hypothetical protein
MEPDADGRAVQTLFQLLDDFLAPRQEHEGLRRIHSAYQAWNDVRRRDGCLASGAPACPTVDWPRPSSPVPLT